MKRRKKRVSSPASPSSLIPYDSTKSPRLSIFVKKGENPLKNNPLNIVGSIPSPPMPDQCHHEPVDREIKSPPVLLVDFHSYLKKKLFEWERTVDELGLIDCVEVIKSIHLALGQTPYITPSLSEHNLQMVKGILLALIAAGADPDEVDSETSLTSINLVNLLEDMSLKNFLILKCGAIGARLSAI
jgi:hypothetical protein